MDDDRWPEDRPAVAGDLPVDNFKGSFYSVFAPGEVRPKGFEVCKYIFGSKVEAMKFVKKTKKARFRHFEFYDEAVYFASHGLVEQPRRTNIRNGSIMKTAPISAQSVGEKMSPFKGPKPQDLVKLRKGIETGNYDAVRAAVWENPRYLVSSGDTPSILQEGFRYNALHVAAKAKNGPITELILSTVSDDGFIRLLYGDDSHENVENRIQVLLDLYLNTPDKGLNETPLHFAVKFGAADVVEVLVSFSQCDKTLRNKFGQTPDMIICDRCDKNAVVKKRIAMLLENNYYVPILRADDNSTVPVIGEPFSPGNAPVMNRDPLSPRLEIHAYAGPMNKQGAEQFRKVWKTPPRTSTPVKKKTDGSMDSLISLRYTDHSKGLERLGQKLASKFEVSWKEYWPFLDSFVDIASAEGLDLFEGHLAGRAAVLDRSWTGGDVPSFDGPSVRKSNNHSTMSDLCSALQACTLNDRSFEVAESCDDDFDPFLCVEKACDVFANRIACDITNRIDYDFAAVAATLEGQIKQVELLVTSYLEDSRFNRVNFQSVHTRLGQLTGRKLSNGLDPPDRKRTIEKLAAFMAEYDRFSSDEEASFAKDSKPTSTKKQLVCLMRDVLGGVGEGRERELQGEGECADAWGRTKECPCAFSVKRARKVAGVSRNNSFKRSGLTGGDYFSRKLRFQDESMINGDLEVSCSVIEPEDDDPDERFYTPPSTPSAICDSDDEDEFSDTQLLVELFIEGDNPTKTDCAVFSALRYADCRVDPKEHPNVYRWHHNVGLYSEEERKSWPSSDNNKNSNKSHEASPLRDSGNSPAPSAPTSKSWLRITGASSPKATLKARHK